MLVFARVFSSTRLTITAQYSPGPAEPSRNGLPAVVPGSLPGKPRAGGEPGPSLYCAVIVKRVDEKTRAKTSINELLRD